MADSLLARQGHYRIEIVSVVGLVLLAGFNLYTYFSNNGRPPQPPVDLLGAEMAVTQIPRGGMAEFTFQFKKNRDDCDNGRANRFVWNADGVWLPITIGKPVRQAPASPDEQPIHVNVPLVHAETGEPIPSGSWSLHTIILYECPHDGKMLTMDATINSPVFEIVAR